MAQASARIFEIDVRGETMILTPRRDLFDVLFDGYQPETDGILATIDKQVIRSLVVDLRHTSRFGSDFLVVLIKIWKRVRGLEGRMVLCNVAAPAEQTLRICDLDRIWTIRPSLTDALESLEPPAG